MKILRIIPLLLTAGALAACTQGTSVTPTVTQANLNANTLQFAVGTANIGSVGAAGTVGLNTVSTFRQPNGNSAVLVDTPTITVPAGFVIPAAGGVNAGTNTMTGTPQTFATPAPPADTFGQSNGVFSYGIEPFNATSTGGARYAGNPQLLSMPFWTTAANQQRFVGGPPAYPFFNDGTYPNGFQGYGQGFDDFAAAPVTGTYTLSVAVLPQNAPSQTFTASATLSSLVPLPAIAPPTFVRNASGDGGGTGVVTVPADPRIVETMVYIVNRDQVGPLGSATYYTVGPLRGTGAIAYTLPNNLGLQCTVSGCAPSPTRQPSFLTLNPATGATDRYLAYAVSYDYPMYEASVPISNSPSPVITGAGGQADLTSSKSAIGTY